MAPPSPALRRNVLYIGGFFTGGPAFYRAGLEREAARFSRVRGVPVSVEDAGGGADSDLTARYRLRAATPEGPVEVAYELLRWEDIVLDHFARPWSWRLREGAATLLDTLANGVFLEVLRRMRRFAMVWLFPFVYYPLALALAALAGLAVDALVGGAAGFASGFLAGCLVLAAAGAFGRRNFAYLFLNDWIFNRAVALDRTPELWTRIDAFADRAAERLREGAETVIVGHSFGASLAPLVAARLGQRHPGLVEAGGLTVVTLGGSPALIGLHPAARRFREGIEAAAGLEAVPWIDVSSSHDAINIKRYDPVARFGLRGRGPILLDTRFGRVAGRGPFAKLGLMRLHMQFLKAAERGDGYDYIGILTGRRPVREALEALR
jgi:hypothetical protein